MKAEHQLHGRGCVIAASNGSSTIVDLSPVMSRSPDSIITPPNSSIMFAECAAIPVLSTEITPGESWLCCAVRACGQHKDYTAIPQLQIKTHQVVIREPESARQLSFFL